MKPYITWAIFIHILLFYVAGHFSWEATKFTMIQERETDVKRYTAEARKIRSQNIIEEIETVRDILEQLEQADLETETETEAETETETEAESAENEKIVNEEREDSPLELDKSQEQSLPEIVEALAENSDQAQDSGSAENTGLEGMNISQLIESLEDAKLELGEAVEHGFGKTQGGNGAKESSLGEYLDSLQITRGRGYFNSFVGEIYRNEVPSFGATDYEFKHPELMEELSWASIDPARNFVGEGEEGRWFFIPSWYTIGPFPFNYRYPRAYAPESHVDLDGVYSGKEGLPVEWRYLQSNIPNIIPASTAEESVHYAYTEIRSDRKRDVWMAFSADDSLQVWVNGEEVWDSVINHKPWSLVEVFKKVTLKAGYNRILYRIENYEGPAEYSALVKLIP